MAQSCDAGDLATAARCFAGMSPIQQGAAQISLLCAIATGTTVICDANSIATAAKCFTGISPIQQNAIIIYLLCVISGGGSGGDSGQIVQYTSGTPANPADTTKPAIAYDPTGNLPTLGWNTGTLTWN